MMHAGSKKKSKGTKENTKCNSKIGIKSEGKQEEKATDSGKVIVSKSGVEARGEGDFEDDDQNVEVENNYVLSRTFPQKNNKSDAEDQELVV